MQNSQKQLDNLRLAQGFEVEELEERVEFGKWSAEAEAGATCSGGGDCSGYVKEATVTYTITF